MSHTFTVQSQIVGVRALNDGGLSLTFHTKELTSPEKALAMEFQNTAGWLLFAENKLQEKDIPDVTIDDEIKSPSQRLRAVLYVLWKQRGEQGSFQNFYVQSIEIFINAIKQKLDQNL